RFRSRLRRVSAAVSAAFPQPSPPRFRSRLRGLSAAVSAAFPQPSVGATEVANGGVDETAAPIR
ncbi:MAG: hypothetical protein ABTQ28_12415, partial [Thauera sp.]